ncbi:MAG: hypothetical protein Q8O14_11350 [bacterium]|jgi:hypothetical protein|nr:hypothetical protein [bacterium]
MKRFLPLFAAGLGLLLAFGCSQDSRPPESGGRLLSRDQVRLLSPADFAGKDRVIDAMGDFTLQVLPGEASVVEGEAFRLVAPAGAVSQPVTIHAQWLGGDGTGEIGFNFTPEGQEFLLPLHFELTLPLQPADLPAGDELMVLYDREDGWYEVISNEVHWLSVDEKATMLARLEHFTKYLIATGPPPDPDPDNN